MAELPVIKTPRTVMNAFTDEHLTPRYIDWLNDPEVVRYSQQRLRSHDRAGCEAFMKSFQGSPNHFSAIIAETHGHIGNISTTIDPHNSIADIAIMIGEKEIWGQGYGEEVWQAAMEALFDLNMRLVTGGCMANNKGMIRVMKKSGMKPYYTREKFFVFGDEHIDSVHFVAENPAWK